MIIPENIRKCVVFVGYRMTDGEMRFAGSAFFAGQHDQSTGLISNVCLVTAKHVIEGIRKLGLDRVFVRGNTHQGQSQWLGSLIDRWLSHPSDATLDVSISWIGGVPPHWDHLILPLSLCATREVQMQHAIGLGDEVFITGLFRHHHGQSRNIPIVRTGNIAAFSEERVVTKEFGPMDAYLVEARSIGGLSGSPVFVNLGSVRYLDGQIKHSLQGPMAFLLGLVHGHYDIDDSGLDTPDSAPLSHSRINTGIAIVVPAEKIIEVFEIVVPDLLPK